MRIFNQSYTLGEIWALKRSIAGVLAHPPRLLNGARAGLSMRLNSPALLADPVLLLVEPSSRCNLSCRFCPTMGAEPGEQGELDMALYERLLDECGDRLIFLCLWFYGEPLLHPELERMVRMARQRGIMVAVSTNGVALTPQRASALLDADLDWLFVSLDGATAATHDGHRGAGSFDRTVENLRWLLTERRRKGLSKPLVELKPILHRDNEHERDAMLALGRELGADRVTFQKLTWTHNPALREHAPRDEHMVLSYPQGGPRAQSCHRSLSSAVVAWDGTLLPCCEDHGRSLPMGHLDHDGMLAAWRGHRWHGLRQDQRLDAMAPALCRRCHIADFEQVNLSVPLRGAPLQGLRRALRRRWGPRSATG